MYYVWYLHILCFYLYGWGYIRTLCPYIHWVSCGWIKYIKSEQRIYCHSILFSLMQNVLCIFLWFGFACVIDHVVCLLMLQFHALVTQLSTLNPRMLCVFFMAITSCIRVIQLRSYIDFLNSKTWLETEVSINKRKWC